MIAFLQSKYDFLTPHLNSRDENSLRIMSIQNKVALAACSIILLTGTTYYLLTTCNAYYCKPNPPCEPSFCELHQFERILGGSCSCPERPNS